MWRIYAQTVAQIILDTEEISGDSRDLDKSVISHGPRTILGLFWIRAWITITAFRTWFLKGFLTMDLTGFLQLVCLFVGPHFTTKRPTNPNPKTTSPNAILCRTQSNFRFMSFRKRDLAHLVLAALASLKRRTTELNSVQKSSFYGLYKEQIRHWCKVLCEQGRKPESSHWGAFQTDVPTLSVQRHGICSWNQEVVSFLGSLISCIPPGSITQLLNNDVAQLSFCLVISERGIYIEPPCFQDLFPILSPISWRPDEKNGAVDIVLISEGV